MESERPYDAQELQSWIPGAGLDRLRDIMHELWIERQVERVGHSGWRRHRSASPHLADAAPGDNVQLVTPEELFDHAAFADFFK